ncbi:MAG TPA: nitroreductase/quinone reductase family protein [Blastocatellia bacterium]|nr:nitroreductase/quinone reductase family protein [Blastocatellia bacterium]
MLLYTLERLEAEYFRTLNQLVEPALRAGFFAPGLLFPAGGIVIETRGRKTGLPSSVPLLAAMAGDLVIVCTIRRSSNWLKNLSAQPEVRYWLNGRERQAKSFTIASGKVTGEEPPERTRCLVNALRRHSALFGTGFAILIPTEFTS